MTGTVDLNPNHLATVEAILADHVPEYEVRAFGSRATWTARDYSDLDLAVVGKGPLDWRTLSRLKEAFEESDLPMRVDVLDWHSTSESFRKVMAREYVVVQKAAKKLSASTAVGWLETNYGIFRRDFQVDSLGNLCSNGGGIQTGPFGSQLHQRDYVPEGTPIITVEHLGENRITHQNMPYVSDHDRKRLDRYTLRKGDIVFSRVGSVDRRVLVRETEDGWLFSGRCLRVRPDVGKVDPAYLSYFFGLPAFKEYIRSIAVGATMPSLNTQILRDVPIVYPSLPEQRAIAHILGTLDDKIELNRRMNETLEEMARALFKSWFVDFEPVRAKMEGRWRRGASLPGLPADLYDLGPDKLVPSELGDIPEGWEVKALGELCSLRAGSVFRKGSQGKKSGKYPFIKVRDMNLDGNSVGILNATNWVDDDDIEQLKARHFPSETTVFAKIGEGLRHNRIRMLTRLTLIDNNMMGAVPNNDVIEPIILFHVLSQFDFGEIAGGTALPYLTAAALNRLLVPIPRPKQQFPVSGYLRSMYERLMANEFESRALAAQREALLPKLVSGGIRVYKTPNGPRSAS